MNQFSRNISKSSSLFNSIMHEINPRSLKYKVNLPPPPNHKEIEETVHGTIIISTCAICAGTLFLKAFGMLCSINSTSYASGTGSIVHVPHVYTYRR
jgi:hypothetical protein